MQRQCGTAEKKKERKGINPIYSHTVSQERGSTPSTHTQSLFLNQISNSNSLPRQYHIMINNSYHLVSTAPHLTGSVPIPPSPSPKRRPGRPPKAKTTSTQPNGPQPQPQPGIKKRGRPPKQQEVQIQHLEHQIMMEPAEVPFLHPTSQNGPPKRRPGRPPKQHQQPHQPPLVPFATAPQQPHLVEGAAVVKKRPGRPAKYSVAGAGAMGRPRGRPMKNALGLSPVGKRRPGRPPKQSALATAVGMVAAKRRGRPAKGSGPPMIAMRSRKLSGKPLGRPKKDAAILKKHASDQAMVNQELTRKLELIQSKVRDVVGVIKPYIAGEYAALMTLQQLEELVTPTATAPLTAPPMVVTPMALSGPPIASAPVSFIADPNATAAPTGTATAPVMNAPPPFSINLPPMTVATPFQAPPAINNQQPMSWLPSSETQS